MGIEHCGHVRRSVTWWLKPTSEEARHYRNVVLEAIDCPACATFVLEWHGINLQKRRTPPHRIRQKKWEEWILRTKTDKDEEMDSSGWEADANNRKRKKFEVYWTVGSLPCAPWNFRRSPAI